MIAMRQISDHSDFFKDIRNFVFGAPENRPGVNLVLAFSRNDMDMKMRYRLSGTFSAGVQKIHAVIAALLHTVEGYFFHGFH